MADISILTGPLQSSIGNGATGSCLFTIDKDTMFLVWADPNGIVGPDGAPGGDGDTNSVNLYKTVDGGLSWTFVSTIGTHSFTVGQSFACYYDRWTPNYTDDDLIHCVWSQAGLDAGLRYGAFSGSTGLVSVAAIDISTVSGQEGNTSDDQYAIVRLPNGDVFVVMQAFNNGYHVYRQADGALFTTSQGPEIAEITSLPGSPPFSGGGEIFLFPAVTAGNFLMVTESGDDLHIYEWVQADLEFIFLTSLATNVDTSNADYVLTCTQRHSDSRIFYAYQTTSGAAIVVGHYDIDGTSSGQLSTLILAGSDDVLMPHLMCVQQTGELYCCYLRGVDVNNLDVYYKRSPNGGVQWEDEVLFSDTSAVDIDRLFLPRSTRGGDEGLLLPVWYDDDISQFRNSNDRPFPVGGYRVGTPSQQVSGVSCESGQETAAATIGGEEASPRFMAQRFPNNRFGRTTTPVRLQQVLWLNFDGNTGSLDNGDTVQGQRSGATATVYGFVPNPDRIGLTNVKSGPGAGKGTPFLPGETILVTSHVKASTMSLSTNLQGTSASAVEVIEDVVDNQT